MEARISRDTWSHATLVLAGLFAIWAGVLTVRGGFDMKVAGITISSNEPRRPVAMASLAAACGWLLASRGERRRLLARADTITRAPWIAPVIVVTAAASVMGVGLSHRSPHVGGADVYGYVSQADLWAHGALSYREPMLEEFDWPFAHQAIPPIGYWAAQGATTVVPIFPPGLPLVLAAVQLVAGRWAVFSVVPVLAGLAVWCTYLMGARLMNRTTGVAAALLLATSPVLMFYALIPMSDVPATAWWALVLALVTYDRRSAALAAGLAASAAVATRPNLAPLAIVAMAPLAHRAITARAWRGPAAHRLLWFAAGLLPGVLLVASLNARLFGGPFVTGQMLVNPPFSVEHAPLNLSHYFGWLLHIQTPIVLLAFAAPFVLRTCRVLAISWLVFAAVTLLSYLFYVPTEGWRWLRYLLPAFPAIFALGGAALVAGFDAYGRGVRVVGMAILVGLLSLRGVWLSHDEQVLDLQYAQEGYAAAGSFISSRLPAKAVFISVLHSGSIRYYSGRPTIRFDFIPPAEFDRVVADLRNHDYRPYLALERLEESLFRERFNGHTRAALLDWDPVFTARDSTVIYELK
jgi:hypothetical protein